MSHIFILLKYLANNYIYLFLRTKDSFGTFSSPLQYNTFCHLGGGQVYFNIKHMSHIFILLKCLANNYIYLFLRTDDSFGTFSSPLQYNIFCHLGGGQGQREVTSQLHGQVSQDLWPQRSTQVNIGRTNHLAGRGVTSKLTNVT